MTTDLEKFSLLQTRLLDHALACSAVNVGDGEGVPKPMHDYIAAMEIYQAMAPHGIAFPFHSGLEKEDAGEVATVAPVVLPEGLTLERLACDPTMGRLTASPAQRALMRAADGLVVDLPNPGLVFHFNTLEPYVLRPDVVIVRSGVRTAKSLIGAMALLFSVLTCKLRRPPMGEEIHGSDGLVGVLPGELVRAVILCETPSAFQHIVGTMRESPILSPMLLRPLTNTCVIRRPDGIEVLIQQIPDATTSVNLRSTWLAGALFDEADDNDYSDNLVHQLRAVRARLLSGAQAWVVSSPRTNASAFHRLFSSAFAKYDEKTLAFHSDARSMNPALSKADEEAERRRDPQNAAREYDAIPLVVK